MQPDPEQFRGVFRAEVTELLVGMEQRLLALEGSFAAEGIRQVFEAAHTLKGTAAMMGFAGAARLAHAAEDLLEKLCEGALPMTAELSTLLLQSVDALRLRIGLGQGGEATLVDTEEVERRLVEAARGASSESSSSARPAKQEAPPLERAVDPKARKEKEPERTLRVELDRLDRMLDFLGEISIARGRLATMLEGTESHSREALLEVHRETDRLYLDLQELLMKARMVPIGRAFQPFARVLRDIAAVTGKLVKLETSGEDLEVDASIVDRIRDPLTHLIRNAVDHGVELPDVRRARGKPACGVVSLHAQREAGSVIVRVADDGAGLDRDRIRARARATGLLGEGEERDDASLLQLVFEPGFTTASRLTEISGRGIGMDVVKRNVEALRGSVFLETKAGVGTVISLRLPLSLSILDGFSVRVGADTFVLPLEDVVECVDLREDERGSGPMAVLNLRGRPLPYLRLRDVFGVEGERPPRESVVVVDHAGGRAGIAVDALLGQCQTVIKPLGELFHRASGVSGSAVLGDGRVALILDVGGLLQKAGALSKGPKGTMP